MPDINSGWVHDPIAVDIIREQLNTPYLFQAGPDLIKSSEKKICVLTDNFTKLGIEFPLRTQEIGDCVSMGTAIAVDTLAVTEIVNGEREKWIAPTATEDIYWGSRILVGKGRLGSSDGSIGAWAVKYIQSQVGGTLRKIKYDFADLSKYSGLRARSWGSGHAPKEQILTECRKNSITNFTGCSSYRDICDALFNGYPVIVCSNQGFNKTRDKDGFCLPQGSWGHCYHPNSILYGPTKVDKITNFSTDDYVYNKDGSYNNITALHKRQYNGKMILLKTKKGKQFVTEDHIFLVKSNGSTLLHRPYLNYNEGYKYQNSSLLFDGNSIKLEERDSLVYVRAKDLQITDKLICPKYKLAEKSIVPQYDEGLSKSKVKNLVPSSEAAWLFGLYLGDGSSCKNHKTSIVFNANDTDCINRAQKAFELVFGIKAHIYKRKNANAVDVKIYNATVANFMIKWFGSGENKSIPAWLMTKEWDLFNLVKGFCDADGTYIKRVRTSEMMQMSNCSYILINQLNIILSSLNYNTGMWISKSTGGFEARFHQHFLSVNPDKKNSEDIEIEIRKIEEVEYSGEVISLEVDGDHTYVCNSIVSHNCMAFLGFDDSFKRPGVLCVNSWGNYCGGPKRHSQPNGSFWVDAEVVEKMCKFNDTWAISGFNGFRAKANMRIL